MAKSHTNKHIVDKTVQQIGVDILSDHKTSLVKILN